MTPIDGLGSSKRRRNAVQQQHPTRSHPRRAKRRKIKHPTKRPAEFWDALSDIDLTPEALEEWERRAAPDEVERSFPQVNARHPSAACLLSRFGKARSLELKRLARGGGPDLSDIRGYPPAKGMGRQKNQPRRRLSTQAAHNRSRRDSANTAKTAASRSSAAKSVYSSTATARSRTTTNSPYDRAFQQHLIRHGIYPDGYEYPAEEGQDRPQAPRPPDNLAEIRDLLTRPCPRLAERPTDEQFGRFRREDTQAAKEQQVKTCVVHFIEGDVADMKAVSGDVPFTNLDHLTDGTISASKPDLFHGARPEQLDQRICDELSGHVVPSTQEDLPILPNFFVAVKGPDGSLAVAARQALYDGTLGERGILSLRAFVYGQGDAEPVFDNKAHTISEIYHGGQLKIYAIHAIPPAAAANGPARQGRFSMMQVKTFALTSGPDEYRVGVTAHVNARAWAKAQRDTLISLANRKPCSGASSEPTAVDVAAESHDAHPARRGQPRTALPQTAGVRRRYLLRHGDGNQQG
ncbi:MAG: hypothetical protein HETSPECPRED_008863 [Heterodermia speciosa]|uniref:Uncharacterized protein n=1 Tax=Heterodermia speciosa TaxID=116794 RepID=A0A8H3EPE4_9LECA|nr:MAG: hypothetical protein HETSPECPRED_008863 [Heterodermia speciosa]